jgi:hypothetical protein
MSLKLEARIMDSMGDAAMRWPWFEVGQLFGGSTLWL